MVGKVTTPQLVLFDIDGTLIYHAGSYVESEERFKEVIRSVWGVAVDFDFASVRGSIDRAIAWDLVKEKGVTKEEYERKFPDYSQALKQYLTQRAKRERVYFPVPEAKLLVETLSRMEDITLGILTGNVERVAWWKLSYTGYRTYFRFGVFGDEADSRILLAHRIQQKAKDFFRHEFQPRAITVIGDTIYDLRAGRAIGAKTIAVATGGHSALGVLAKEKPDLAVETLADNRVLSVIRGE